MRNIIIALGLLATATLAYFALSTSSKKSVDSAGSVDSNKGKESESSASDTAREGFVAPRRMRSDSNMPSDELSSESRRRMDKMGRGGGGPWRHANRGNGLESTDELSEEEQTAREKARAEVMARRTSQWITDADKSGDGLLSPEEAELGGPGLRRILTDFASADSNGDGAINEEELNAAASARRADREEQRGSR